MKLMVEEEHFQKEYSGFYIYSQLMNEPDIWPGFVQLLPFKCFEVETETQFEMIFGRNEKSEMATRNPS